MKIALVNVNQEGQTTNAAPLGLCSIAAYLKKYGGFNDITLLNQNVEDVFEKSKGFDVIGISCVTQTFNIAKKYVEFVKENFGTPVVFGGVHVSIMPSNLPVCADVGIIGEGEETMLQALNHFKERGDFKNMHGIQGLCFWENNELVITEKRPLIEPLDKIPMPDRSLLNMDYYLQKSKIVPFKYAKTLHLITSRGCPYKCVFCSTTAFWEKFRAFSAQRVVEEIEFVLNTYDVEIIYIFDDLFVADKKRLSEVVRLIKLKGLKEKLQLMCLTRANLMNDEMMVQLKEINVICVGFGAESASEKVLKYLKCGSVTVAHNLNAIELCKKYEIIGMATFMIGSPGETEEDLMKTLHLIQRNRGNSFLYSMVWLTTPFPATELWEEGKRRGIVTDDFNWDDLAMNMPRTLEELKKTPNFIDIDLQRFHEILQLFALENEREHFKNYTFVFSWSLVAKALSKPHKLPGYLYSFISNKTKALNK